MLRILLSLMTVAAVATESAGQPPAATAPPAPPAAAGSSAGDASATGAPRRLRPGEPLPESRRQPHQLAPARINAEGELVVRHHVELSETIPCVALKKAADGKTAEEPRAGQPFKPTVQVVYDFLYLADVSWFDRNGKQVDAEAARKQLAKWTPVLVLPQEEKPGFPARFGGLLLESYRSDLLIAVAPESASLGCERDAPRAKGAVPESPLPTRVRMNEKGRVIFRPILRFKPVYETRERTVTWNTETGPCTKRVLYKVRHLVMEIRCEELAVEPSYVQFFDTEGNPVEAAAAAQRLAKEETVLVSADGEKVNAFYLKAAQPNTLVCVVSFNISAARPMAPVPTPTPTSQVVPKPPRAPVSPP